VSRSRANPSYIPSQHLVHRYALKYNWEPVTLAAVLTEFGPLPEEGQKQLIDCLVLAYGRYQMLARSIGRIPPSRIRNQLVAIETTTQKLLLQLGVNPNKVQGCKSSDASEQLQRLREQDEGRLYLVDQLSFASIETTDKDQAAVNAELPEAIRRVTDDVFGLLDLHERAKKAVQTATKRTAPGKGGPQHRPHAEGQLIRDAITIYEHMRSQYPNSGNKPGYGGPMLRFIHAVAALFGAHVRDANIRDAWDTHTRKSKRK
jgi:hypothetical protein